MSCARVPIAPRPATPAENTRGETSGVGVALRGPAHAPYIPTILRAEAAPVSLILRNSGARPVRVGSVEASFRALREGVEFPCAPPARVAAREPSSLQPGESFTIERDLGCVLPLPGTYVVSVDVRLGDGVSRPAGTFPLVVDAGPVAPRPYPGRPGLFVLVVGDNATELWTADQWARGAYRVLVAAINASDRALPVGPVSVTFDVHRHGSPLTCAGQAERVDLPEYVMPGATALGAVPLTCAPEETGAYDVIGRVLLEGDTESVEAGRLGLTVAHDPLRFAPIPDPVLERGRPGRPVSP
jgi:hypothetical protein